MEFGSFSDSVATFTHFKEELIQGMDLIFEVESRHVYEPEVVANCSWFGLRQRLFPQILMYFADTAPATVYHIEGAVSGT